VSTTAEQGITPFNLVLYCFWGF